jgi:hypothetical protein
MGKVQSNSLIHCSEIQSTDSDEEVQEEQCNNTMVIVEPKRAPVSYRAMSAKLSSMTRFDNADLKKAAHKMTGDCDVDYPDHELLHCLWVVMKPFG